MKTELEEILNDGGYNTVRMDKPSQRDGAIWGCKIGIQPGTNVKLPGGCDLPMRKAVEKAFKEITGLDAEFCFSGWGETLTDGERWALMDEPCEEE